MGNGNAVVMPHVVISELSGLSISTIKRALTVLEQGKWIQVLKIGKGKESAYVINDRVAWTQAREKLYTSTFTASIVLNRADQSEKTLSADPLKQLPQVFSGETQVPNGKGKEPPAQPALTGLEHELPVRDEDHGQLADRASRWSANRREALADTPKIPTETELDGARRLAEAMTMAFASSPELAKQLAELLGGIDPFGLTSTTPGLLSMPHPGEAVEAKPPKKRRRKNTTDTEGDDKA
jgi:hypothetical protein